jgi:hypothetical protein
MPTNVKDFRKFFTVYRLMWLVYVIFLGVLAPHTAWTFSQFQETKDGNPMAWMLAISVELVIAVFTHKLSEHLTATRKAKGTAAVLRWLNGYSVGLTMVLLISSIANLAYAVEFAGSLAVFVEWGINRMVYEFAFGAMLPFVSLVFALVLSQMAEGETDEDPALAEAKKQIAELRQVNRESERQRKEAEAARKVAEERFGMVTDIASMFLLEDKTQRIRAIYGKWNNLPNSAIAIMADAAPSTVSEVIKSITASKN